MTERAPPPAEPAAGLRARRALTKWGPPGALVLGALALCAYSVVAHGATDGDSEALFVVGSQCPRAARRGAACSAGASPACAPTGRAWIGLAMLVGLAAWSALSLAWSVQPERTWHYVNREGGLRAARRGRDRRRGRSAPSVERLAYGWLAIATVTALYALGGKVAPGRERAGALRPRPHRRGRPAARAAGVLERARAGLRARACRSRCGSASTRCVAARRGSSAFCARAPLRDRDRADALARGDARVAGGDRGAAGRSAARGCARCSCCVDRGRRGDRPGRDRLHQRRADRQRDPARRSGPRPARR